MLTAPHVIPQRVRSNESMDGNQPRARALVRYVPASGYHTGAGPSGDRPILGITGTETRDPYLTDQLLQQYQSYEIVRYFNNIRPDGRNGGGWVDTFSVRYVDRYPEQLWDTLFAKAPEITLFSWHGMAAVDAIEPGDRTRGEQAHQLQLDEMIKSYKPPTGESAPSRAAPVACRLRILQVPE